VQTPHLHRRQLFGLAIATGDGGSASLAAPSPTLALPLPSRPDSRQSGVELVRRHSLHSVSYQVAPASLIPLQSGTQFDSSGGSLKTSTGGVFGVFLPVEALHIRAINVTMSAESPAGQADALINGRFVAGSTLSARWESGQTAVEIIAADDETTPGNLDPGSIELRATLGPGSELRSLTLDVTRRDSKFVRLPTSVRLLDTRESHRLEAGAIGYVHLFGVLPSHSCALINLTITNTTGVGYLSIEDGGTSNINWDGPNQTRANLVLSRDVGNDLMAVPVGWTPLG
jgi:hypothetical protein